MSELVINQATWMDNGLPVEDTVALENPGGLTVNVETTGEEPLQLSGRCACNAEDVNADTYGDAAEMASRRGKLRADLGLRDEDENPERGTRKPQGVDSALRPVPGFPLESRLAATPSQ